MSIYLAGTNSVHTTAALCDYLDSRVGADDTVIFVNSLRGGDDTSSQDIRDGEDALNAATSRLGERCTVETHQYVRNNSADKDLLEAVSEFEADELIFGIRKRSPTSKVVFGSTAQDLLLNADVPMAVVPLVDME